MMATTLMPLDPATSPQQAIRLLPISADLLPEEVIAARRARRVRAQVGVLLVVLVLLVGGWFGFASFQAVAAQSNLDDATEQAAELTRRQNEFADVITTQNQSTAIHARLGALMKEDVRWATLVDMLRRPPGAAGITVTGLSGGLTSATAGSAATGGAATGSPPGTASTNVVGSLTVSGLASSKEAVATYVEALGKVKQFTNPYLTNASEVDGKVQFSLKIDVTTAALGGRYSPKKGGK